MNNIIDHRYTQKDLSEYGGYNDAPPNMKEISEDEFFHTFLSRNADFEEFRQLVDHSDICDLRMYYYPDGNGIAIGESRKVREGWIRDRVFYSFEACVHDYESVPEESRNCYSVSKCKKCGHVNRVDSSD